MARFFFVKKKHPRNPCESVLLRMKKKTHAFNKHAAKVRKFYFITKVSRKIINFVKSTLQNAQIYI